MIVNEGVTMLRNIEYVGVSKIAEEMYQIHMESLDTYTPIRGINYI